MANHSAHDHQTDVNHVAANTAAAERDRMRAESSDDQVEEPRDAETGNIAGVTIDMTEQKPGDALQLMNEAQCQVIRWRKLRRLTMNGSVALLPILFVGIIYLPSFRNSPFGHVLWMLTGGTIACLIALRLSYVLMHPLQNNPIHRLWSSEDVSAIGSLAEATTLDIDHLTPRATAALIRLLPRVKPQDGERLTPYQRSCLRRLIGRDEPLSLAILSALTEIGTADDLSIVRRLAAGGGIAQRSTAIREAAQKCLPIMEERVKAGRSSDVLLRASGAPTEPGEVLLRAAAGGVTVNSKQLLRPGAAEHDSQDDGEP